MAGIDDVAIWASYDVQKSKLHLCKELEEAYDDDTEEKIRYILSVTDEEERGWRSVNREDLTPGPDEESCEVIDDDEQIKRKPKQHQEEQEDIDEILKFTVSMMDQSNKLTVTHKKKNRQRHQDNTTINNEIQNLNNKSKAEFDEKVRGIKCGRKQKKASSVVVMDPERRKRKKRKKANKKLSLGKDPAVSDNDVYDISPIKDTAGIEDAQLTPDELIQSPQIKNKNAIEDTLDVSVNLQESSSIFSTDEHKDNTMHEKERPFVINTHTKLPKISESNKIYHYRNADDSGSWADSRSSLNDAYAIPHQDPVKEMPTNDVDQVEQNIPLDTIGDKKGHDARADGFNKDKNSKKMGRFNRWIRLLACCCLKSTKLND